MQRLISRLGMDLIPVIAFKTNALVQKLYSIQENVFMVTTN